MTSEDFIESRLKQVSLLQECIDRPSDIDTILKDYPKLLKGIHGGTVYPEMVMIYLKDAIRTYRRTSGDHLDKKFESDKKFSQTLVEDTDFYGRRGLIPPTPQNIKEASDIAKKKMRKQHENPDQTVIRRLE